MSATYAPGPWPEPHASLRGGPWVFGREVVMAHLPGSPLSLQWLLKRNCSITPRQLGWFYASLCAVSLFIGTFFFLQGAPLVLLFTGLELLAVGLALLLFARHAGDREVLTLVGRSLHVEQCVGSKVERTEFLADWLHVEPARGQGSLVQLRGRGQLVHVGRLLRPELRGAFAQELRRALRRVSPQSSTETDPNRSTP
jgi:uncharacterized membrane protein